MKKYRGNIYRVLRYLQEFESISSLEAFKELGVTRLSVVIFRLRKDGFVIRNERMECKNRWGEPCHFDKYILVGTPIEEGEN